MNIAVQTESGPLDVELSATVQFDRTPQHGQVFVTVRYLTAAPPEFIRELVQRLQLRAPGTDALIACVASLDDESDKPTLIFDCQEYIGDGSIDHVEVVWSRNGIHSLGTVTCSTQDYAQPFEWLPNTTLPPEIEVEELPDGVRFVLPRRAHERQTWRLQLPTLFVIIIGLAWVAVMVCGAWTLIETSQEFDLARRAIHYVFVAVCLIGALPGLLPLGILLRFRLDTGSEIELRQGQLAFTERIGPIRRRQSRAVDQIVMFEVYGPTTYFGRRWRRRRVNYPFIVSLGDHPMEFARGYPPRWLDPLARVLADRINRQQMSTKRQRVEVKNQVEVQLDPIGRFDPKKLDVDQQPANGVATCTTDGRRLTIRVPPTPQVIEGSRVGRSTCVMFCIVAMVPAAVAGGIVATYGFANAFVVALVCFTGLLAGCFWFIGLGALWDGIRRGRRVLTITATGAVLEVFDTSRLLSRRQSFDRRQIAVIRPGSIELTKRHEKDQPYKPELQIHLVDGRIIGLLEGHSWSEVAWIGTMLRRNLRVPAVDAGAS